MRAKEKAVVVNDADKPIERQVLAQAIVDISAAMKKLEKSGINRKGLLLLISHSSKRSQKDVSAVLNALSDLARDYVGS